MSEMEPRPPVIVVTNEIVLPPNTNTHGTMFGGDVLALMDKIAAIAAVRFCRKAVVTASTERIDFHTPILLGYFIEAEAWVIHTGKTSMIVRIDVWAEEPRSGERRRCTTGYYSFVAIDGEGHPQPIPPLLVETPQQQADWERGAEIRADIKRRREQRRDA